MKEIRLFDYQEDMKGWIGDAFEYRLSVMVQMPTGTGKTHLLAAVVRDVLQQPEKPCVWIIAHRRELVSQINDTLERFGISSTENQVLVMSIQWLSRHYDEMTKAPKLIVIDEAHHALAETYQEMWKRECLIHHLCGGDLRQTSTSGIEQRKQTDVKNDSCRSVFCFECFLFALFFDILA